MRWKTRKAVRKNEDIQKAKRGEAEEIGREGTMLMEDKRKAKLIGFYFASICLNDSNIYGRIKCVMGQQTMACRPNPSSCQFLSVLLKHSCYPPIFYILSMNAFALQGRATLTAIETIWPPSLKCLSSVLL